MGNSIVAGLSSPSQPETDTTPQQQKTRHNIQEQAAVTSNPRATASSGTASSQQEAYVPATATIEQSAEDQYNIRVVAPRLPEQSGPLNSFFLGQLAGAQFRSRRSQELANRTRAREARVQQRQADFALQLERTQQNALARGRYIYAQRSAIAAPQEYQINATALSNFVGNGGAIGGYQDPLVNLAENTVIASSFLIGGPVSSGLIRTGQAGVQLAGRGVQLGIRGVQSLAHGARVLRSDVARHGFRATVQSRFLGSAYGINVAGIETAGLFAEGAALSVPIGGGLTVAVRGADEFVDLFGASRSLNQTAFESGSTLIFSENLGGHTIRNHVSRTDTQLLERLADDLNIQGASTFTDLNTAERAIGEVLTRNRVEIQNFFGNTSGNRLPLSETLDFDVGRGFSRDTLNPQISNSVRVILDRDELGINGFRIHTAFPILQQRGL